MKFSAKTVRRSVRRFEDAIHDVANSSSQTYKSRVRLIMEMTEQDEVIKTILEPVMNIEIDLNDIHYSRSGFQIDEIRIPIKPNQQIAYILKVFELESQKELSIEKMAALMYNQKNLDAGLSIYLNDVVVPCLRELLYKLSDLIEDEVEGKEEVSTDSLRLINYGSISASNGSNIAMGESITQSTSNKHIISEIMEKVKQNEIIDEGSLEKVEVLAEELHDEINKEEPSRNRLSQIAEKVKDVGEAGLLKVFSTVVTDPRWGQAVSNILLNL